MIERDVPGLGKLSAVELQHISQTSCNVIDQMDQSYQWVQSFVTGDKMYCIHLAESEEAVREHGRIGGFPVNKITEVFSIIDPNTAK